MDNFQIHIIIIIACILLVFLPNIVIVIMRDNKSKQWRKNIKLFDKCFFYGSDDTPVYCSITHIESNGTHVTVSFADFMHQRIEIESLYIA